MYPDKHKNFAYSTVLTVPSPAASGTSLTLASGGGALMPTPPFNATVWPSGTSPLASNAEIVRVTAVATDTLTITRSQESSSARTITAGDQFAATITAKTLTDTENPGLYTYNVMAYGAKADANYATDGAITTGTAILTSATVGFKATDVGKKMYVRGAGTTGGILTTTILSYQSATQVTLAANASTSATGATFYYGTDDTTAFQTALNLVNGLSPLEQSVTVFVPDGLYLIDGTLSLAGGSNLKGASMDSVMLLKCHANGSFINMNSGQAKVSDMTLFNGATSLITSGSAITVSVYNCRIRDVALNWCYNGIEVASGGWSCFMSGISIENYVNTGLYVHDTYDVYIDQFFFQAKSQTMGALGGIRLYNSVQAFMASNGDITQGVYAMTIDAAANTYNTRPQYNQFVNVDFDTAANGVLINNSTLTKFTGCWFASSTSTNGGHGCSMSNTVDFTFNGCYFLNNQQIGLVVNSSCTHTKVISSSIISNNVGNTGQPGVYVNPGTTDFSFIGNTATNTAGLPGLQAWGINIGQGSCDRYQIINNLVNGNATGGITDNGTGTNKIVQDQDGNFLLGLPNQFISIANAAPYTLTSQTALQKLFNTSSTGAYNVYSATTYFFECEIDLSSMSATSGTFNFGFGGTATITSLKYTAQATKAAIGTPSAPQMTTATVATTTPIVTASTATTGHAYITGIIRTNVGGTIIPSVGLSVAAAAIVGANSWFRITQVGANTTTNVGKWT